MTTKKTMQQQTDLSMWAHSLQEYQSMFDLSQEDLDKKIIDCAAGASSFSAQMRAMNRRVIACDGLYALPELTLQATIDTALSRMFEQMSQSPEKFSTHLDLKVLRCEKEATIKRLMQDFSAGLHENRYRPDLLPTLGFQDCTFDIALCSHFLLTTPELDRDFHLLAIKNMCRIAQEARIFPLLDHTGEVTELTGELLTALQEAGYGTEIRQVDYALQKSGNAMLRIWAVECEIE